jgi:hypothetical protein
MEARAPATALSLMPEGFAIEGGVLPTGISIAAIFSQQGPCRRQPSAQYRVGSDPRGNQNETRGNKRGEGHQCQQEEAPRIEPSRYRILLGQPRHNEVIGRQLFSISVPPDRHPRTEPLAHNIWAEFLQYLAPTPLVFPLFVMGMELLPGTAIAAATGQREQFAAAPPAPPRAAFIRHACALPNC